MNSTAPSRPVRAFRKGSTIATRRPKDWTKIGVPLRTRKTGHRLIPEKDDKMPKTLGEMLKLIRAAGPDPGPFVREHPPFPERDFMKD
jgi:hypothetical protein